MLTGRLLVRGMLAGILAGLICVGFARVFGESQVQRAIDFETARAFQEAAVNAARGVVQTPEPELVSRGMQRSFGLLTATVLAGIGLGGLYSLVFALAYGRIGGFGPRALAALLAVAGFVAVVFVPELKYPANPPAVGDPATIGLRTGLFFEMLLASLAAMTLAILTARGLARRLGAWNAGLAAACLFVVVIGAVQRVLPDINEVPENFPAVVLWRFRVASLGTQMVLWGTLGLAFGYLAERAILGRTRGAAGRRPGLLAR